jgi:hypothetical protein
VPVVGSSSPTPAVRAFSDLKNEVARYVKAPNDTDALAAAGSCINNAIRRLNTRAWQWSLTYQDITLAASDASYSLAAAFKAPRHAELLDSSGNAKMRLDWALPKNFLEQFEDRSTNGDPHAYTVLNFQDAGELLLSAPPSSSFVSAYPTLRLWYFPRLQVLAGDSDVMDECPSEVELFVTWYAKAEMAATYDPGLASYAAGEWRSAWQALVRDDVVFGTTDWSE